MAPAPAGDAPGLLQSAQIAAGQVGRAARVHLRDRRLHRRLVGQRTGRDRDGRVLVEGDQAETVVGVELVDQRGERGLGLLQPGTGHRPAAVEHDDQGARSAVGVGRLLGGGQLDQHGELVVGLVGEDIQIEMSGEVHGGRPVCR